MRISSVSWNCSRTLKSSILSTGWCWPGAPKRRVNCFVCCRNTRGKVVASAALATNAPESREKRVRDLVYAGNFTARGGVCNDCMAVFPNDTMNCDFCGLPVKPSDDLVETAIEMALAEGAVIEQVRGEAAAELKAADGIGAFLRY